MKASRVESDSLGSVRVPKSVYYGAQTERARRNFPISGLRMPPRFIRSMAMIKAEAARVNQELGVVDAEVAAAIVAAADEIESGRHEAHFPVDVFQTGSGTSTNMNVNEVIANRAIELLGGEIGSKSPVHPNDHVNASQSSNDTIPSAIHISAYGAVQEQLRPALQVLARSLESKAAELDEVVKIGRTHLQDAVPVRLGQELGGHAQQVRGAIERLDACLPRIAELALGGTATGTGLNAPRGFADRVIARLAERTGYAFVPGSSSLRGDGGQGRGRGALRSSQSRGGLPDQDRQRRALAGVGAALRSRRDHPAEPATGQLDHARKGQSRGAGGGAHGRRPGPWATTPPSRLPACRAISSSTS